MSAVAPQILIKTPDESILYAAEFAAALGDGETISGIEEITQTTTGSGALTISNQAIVGTQVRYRVAGGTDGETYTITVEITTSAGNVREVVCTLQVSVGEIFWTSRSQLEAQFGLTNIEQWADLENEGSEENIAGRISWAIAEAQSDAELLLYTSPVDVDAQRSALSSNSMLRRAVTIMAAVKLYESRGIVDYEPDGDGKHRLSQADKSAKTFFKKVQAGQIRLAAQSDTASTVIVIVPNSDDGAVVADGNLYYVDPFRVYGPGV